MEAMKISPSFNIAYQMKQKMEGLYFYRRRDNQEIIFGCKHIGILHQFYSMENTSKKISVSTTFPTQQLQHTIWTCCSRFRFCSIHCDAIFVNAPTLAIPTLQFTKRPIWLTSWPKHRVTIFHCLYSHFYALLAVRKVVGNH